MSTGREALLVAGERLIAEHGAEVPLRDIARAAGQRNTSAVNYHFGSREGLISEVLEVRTAPQQLFRLQGLARLEAAGADDDVRALVALLVEPWCVTPYEQGSRHYARFLAQVHEHPVLTGFAFDPERWPAAYLIVTRLYRLLADLPDEVRRRRLTTMNSVIIAVLADHERRTPDSSAMKPPADLVEDLTEMVVGLVTAPLKTRI